MLPTTFPAHPVKPLHRPLHVGNQIWEKEDDGKTRSGADGNGRCPRKEARLPRSSARDGGSLFVQHPWSYVPFLLSPSLCWRLAGASRPALPLVQLPWAACTPPCLLPVYQAHNGISVCRWVRVRPCAAPPALCTGIVPGRAPLETVWSLLAKGGACLLLCVLKRVIDLLLSSFPGSNQEHGWAAKPPLVPVPAPGAHSGGRQVGAC